MKGKIGVIMRKEFLHIIRDMGTFAVVVLLPVFMVTLFSLILNTDVRNIKVVAVVPSPSVSATQFIEPLKHNPVFVYKGTLATVAEGENLMRSNSINAMVVLHRDFDRIMEQYRPDSDQPVPVQIITDASNCVVGSAASVYLSSALGTDASGRNFATVRMMNNPMLLSVYFFCPGVLAFVIILLCVVYSSMSVSEEKESGTIENLVVSRMTTWEFLLGKLSPYFCIGIISIVTGILSSYFIVGVPLAGSCLVILAITVLYVLTSLLLGFLVASFSKSQVNAYVMSIFIITFPVLYFGGISIPVSNLPEWGQFVSNFIFVRWYTEALRKLMIMGVSGLYILKETAMIAVSTIVLLAACLYRLRKNRWLH